MLTALGLIGLCLPLFLLSLFLMFLGIVASDGAGAGMAAGAFFLGAFSVICIVDACHFMIYGTSLGCVPY